ncbi:hypothetical protein [Geodermatophilus sp. URMC 64]
MAVPEDWWTDDDDLLAVLGEALREEADVPPRVIETGKAIFALYSLESDLAALAAEPAGALAGLRGAQERELTFATGAVTIHVQVTGRQVSGQVTPPQAGEIDLHTVGGRPQRAEVDELGWFTITPAPRAQFRLMFLGASGDRAVTDWIEV